MIIAREVRRDNEEMSRNIARTLTSDSGGNLWHKHLNTSIAPVERQRRRRRHEDTEMGIKLREVRPAGKPSVHHSDEQLPTYMNIHLK
jgi:hypothetical protein